MSCETYETRRFHRSTLAEIERAAAIIADFMAQGFTLTLRQLYYQMVAKALIENLYSEYKRIGVTIKNARRAGLIDWAAIVDRTRHMRTSPFWADPASIISSAAEQYREDIWRGQAVRVEVWIEKDALVGVIEPVCEEFRLPYFACRGNNSETLQYEAGKRFEKLIASGITPIVLHLGDHDPNGLDMTRDNVDRLALFARRRVEVRRLALNRDQIDRYRPPPNFAKETDTRFKAYAEIHGTECWELDALAPNVIADLIRSEVESLIDPDTWAAALAQQGDRRALMASAAAKWPRIESMLRGGAL